MLVLLSLGKRDKNTVKTGDEIIIPVYKNKDGTFIHFNSNKCSFELAGNIKVTVCKTMTYSDGKTVPSFRMYGQIFTMYNFDWEFAHEGGE